ncbi:MAG: hypothetical protein A2X46_17335 [Lentisphaerae bacterium GWF2_57_35]|nr:MAG: hypothetical protein A2X46_17335 [Lentisphaerae bacterium GWF2_57_35]
MIKIAWVLFVIISLGLLTPTVNADESSCQINMATLTETYFNFVEATPTNITVQFKTQGFRYVYSIDGSEPKVNQYGEFLSVPVGSTLTLIERDFRITFSALPDPIKNKGFRVSEIQDNRFRRKGIATNSAFMVITPARNQNQKTGDRAELRFVEPTVEAVHQVLQEQEVDK